MPVNVPIYICDSVYLLISLDVMIDGSVNYYLLLIIIKTLLVSSNHGSFNNNIQPFRIHQ